jgi:uncharacterized protein (TIGR03085 family)
MTRYASSERHDLAELMMAVGPDEPTLCTGWTTRDLAAHLVVRERRPLAAAGVIVKPLADYAERVRVQQAARPYPELVAAVRKAPWWSPVSNPVLDGAFNTLEFFIHHEDVRRGRDGWQPRTLDRDLEAYLFRRAGQIARLSLRRMRATIALNSPGYGELQVGDGTPQARLTGAPGELLLFLSGRQRATQVQVDGTVPLADRLRKARLGI